MATNMTESEILSMHNPQFATYLIVSSLLILKMCGLTLLTIFHRQKNKVFTSVEDTKRFGGTTDRHEDVERVRSAVLNDLENIPVFLFMAFAYLFVGVPNWVVHFLYYLFLIVRCMHSIVYAVHVVPQPARGTSFVVGFTIVMYLSMHVFVHAASKGYKK